MIFDRIDTVKAYASVIPYAAEIAAFCRENDLSALPEGRYEIKGTDLYVNVQQAVTAPFEERGWESHKLYADLQLLVSGAETIAASKASLPQPDDSRPENDYYGYKSMPGPFSMVTLTPGTFAYFAPGEAHAPCCCGYSPVTVKKAVFKIRTQPLE